MSKPLRFDQAKKTMTVSDTESCNHYLTKLYFRAQQIYNQPPTFPNKKPTTYEAILQASKEQKIKPTKQVLESVKSQLIKQTNQPTFVIRNFELEISLEQN